MVGETDWTGFLTAEKINNDWAVWPGTPVKPIVSQQPQKNCHGMDLGAALRHNLAIECRKQFLLLIDISL